MEILKEVFKKSIIIIIPSVILSGLFIETPKLPLGIALGWLFGMFNLRQLARNIAGFVGAEKATLRLVIMSMTRLLGLFAAIFLLVYYRIVNIFGLLYGFSVVFLMILIEGARIAKRH